MTGISAISSGEGNVPLRENSPFKPLAYGSYQDRSAAVTAGKYEYFPECNSTDTFDHIQHFFKIYVQGTFLETYDAHLKSVGDDSKITVGTQGIAAVRASVNFTGKALFGVCLVSSVILPVALGVVAATGGLGLSIGAGKDFDPAGDFYVGTVIGSFIAVGICTGAAFVASSLISVTEPLEKDEGTWDRLKIAGLGTGSVFFIALQSAQIITGVGQTVSEFNYLSSGNVKGFLFLHCFGFPT